MFSFYFVFLISYEDFCEEIRKNENRIISCLPSKSKKPKKDAGLIITEDLVLQKGWRILTQEECTGLEIAKLVIRKMATLHGIMYKWLETQDQRHPEITFQPQIFQDY